MSGWFGKEDRVHQWHTTHEEMIDVEKRGDYTQDEVGPAIERAPGSDRHKRQPERNEPIDRCEQPAYGIYRCALCEHLLHRDRIYGHHDHVRRKRLGGDDPQHCNSDLPSQAFHDPVPPL